MFYEILRIFIQNYWHRKKNSILRHIKIKLKPRDGVVVSVIYTTDDGYLDEQLDLEPLQLLELYSYIDTETYRIALENATVYGSSPIYGKEVITEEMWELEE